MARLSQSTEGLMGSEKESRLATQVYKRLKSAGGRECTKGHVSQTSEVWRSVAEEKRF